MPEQRVVVVGAGVAGLVSALELSHLGLNVTVIDRADTPGGKLHAESVQGHDIDSGPTVFTMRWVFDELMHGLGLRLDRELKLSPRPCSLAISGAMAVHSICLPTLWPASRR